MRTAGVPINLEAFEEELIVRQEGGSLENSIASSFLTRSYIGIYICTYLTMAGNRGVPFELSDFELYLPWKEMPVRLLEDPADPFAPITYTFSPYNAAKFDKSQVIFRTGKMLRRGQSLEGFLLAVDPEPIPAEISHGVEITATLSIFDQFGDGHSSDLILTVDRMAERGPKPAAKPRKGLFDQPDKGAGSLPCEPKGVLVGQEIAM